jgi:frataxin-like iron-binding protein CyaY
MEQKQLQEELERAATSLLTDEEIITSLNIDAEVLAQNYVIVERARLKLKQRLNAKRITDAATQGNTETILVDIPRNNKQKISSRGGARPGGGRPKGSGNKISIIALLESIETECGESFEHLLAQGYAESIETRNHATRIKYEQMFLNKLVADKMEVETRDGSEVIDEKQAAFRAAWAAAMVTAKR